MSWEDRGIAVAMSLGGRAARIAQSIPQQTLGMRNGLATLLAALENALGSEIQDRVRAAGRSFEKYVRPRGLNAAEYIITFESLYHEATTHGMSMNATLLSQKLTDKAQLSEAQETWVLGQVGADFSNYVGIRQALRRLPNLDTRHGSDANMYPAQLEFEDTQHHNSPYTPWTAGSPHLQSPLPEQPHAYPQSTPLQEDSAAYPFDEDADQKSDTEYASIGASDVDSAYAAAVGQAFVMHQRKKRVFRRGGPGKNKGNGKGGKGNREGKGSERAAEFGLKMKVLL